MARLSHERSESKKVKRNGKWSPKDPPPLRSILKQQGYEENKLQVERRGPLSMEERVQILKMHGSMSINDIATAVHRAPAVVQGFLRRHASTVESAKSVLANGAEILARRIVQRANVEESLEVLDRLDVLPRKDRKGGEGEQSVRIVVGAGSNVAIGAAPKSTVPTVEQVQEAIDAQIIQHPKPTLVPAVPEPKPEA